MRIRRYSYQIALEPALMELMRLYDRLGGPAPAAADELNAAVEHCLGERKGGEGMHARLQLLMRARELHRYVMEPAELAGVKLRLCEHLLHHRTAPERWAAVRELLLAELDTICETPLPGLLANVELYKRALSDRTSRLGGLLLTVALFNLDLDGEAPPPNLVIRFRRGAFPLHWWEVCAQDGRTAHLGTVESWSPTHPLSRWEYLAADLAQVLFRRLHEARGQRRWDRGGEPAMEDAAAPGGADHSDAAGPETVYCRFDADSASAQAGQLELFPVEPGALLAALLRRVHAHQGPEGVKLLALLLARLHGAAPGTAMELALPELAAEAGMGDTTARSRRQRVARLERVLTELAHVELTRVAAHDGAQRARTSRLVTVLGRSGGWPAQGAGGERTDTTVQLMTDPYLHNAPLAAWGSGLGAAFCDLPPVLLECAGKERPFVLPLYVWLRRAWSAAGEVPVVERTARALLDEAGIWVSETGRYRAIETLKRDLEFLREQGWLGAWHLRRAEVRDAMEERYRLSAPVAAAPAGRPERREPTEAREAREARLAVLPPALAGGAALTGT